MKAHKLDDGRLVVPRRAEGPDGIIGDGMVEIGPDDPEYEEWLIFLDIKKPEPKADDSPKPD